MIPTELKNRVDHLLRTKDRVLLAIDGSCASGKTTLASALAECYDCNVFSMDDFFLRPEQRTPQRLNQPGGNVDYERFREEVLKPLLSGGPVSYRPFDCAAGSLASAVEVSPKKLNLIEGSYSHHPYFGQPYDLCVFLTVDPEVRAERILQRPAFLHQRFFQEWIPMEQRYFQEFRIAEQADLIL